MKGPQVAFGAGLLAAALAGCAAGSAPVGLPPAPAHAGRPSIGVGGMGLTTELQREDGATTALLRAPAEAVRAALPEAFQEMGITGAALQAGRYGNIAITGHRVAGRPIYEFVRCGPMGEGAQLLTRFRTQLALVSSLAAGDAPDRTALTVALTGRASRIDGTSTGGADCSSNGLLEERLVAAVEAALRRRAG
jgi:hypothetical protein